MKMKIQKDTQLISAFLHFLLQLQSQKLRISLQRRLPANKPIKLQR